MTAKTAAMARRMSMRTVVHVSPVENDSKDSCYGQENEHEDCGPGDEDPGQLHLYPPTRNTSSPLYQVKRLVQTKKKRAHLFCLPLILDKNPIYFLDRSHQRLGKI